LLALNDGEHDERAVLDEFLKAIAHAVSQVLGGFDVNAVDFQLLDAPFLRVYALLQSLDDLIRFMQVFEVFAQSASDLR
jgi:hypothetical protein